ncbi:methyl-accepting chemotaxis protein [Schnuerera sp.]|uniref:methyl-accepting chemotaxis protein n=1 Tax=Schnuerera sp. TaxID=2794844 RepID=UPI002CF22E69|nr:methyl-accepting chemotaxis protein [Schnuerera sp.]HSH35627.1 methyl-accepting chemotaxis protein [Schnuerera sp.]
MNSIKTKLILYFSILILVSTAVIGFIALERASESLSEESEEALASLVHEGARVTESRIETQMRTLEMIALREDIQSMDWELQRPALENQIKQTNFFDIGVVQLNGTIFFRNGRTEELGNQDYIKESLNGKSVISEPITNSETKSISLIYATPIINEGEIVGALVGRREGNVLNDIIKDIRLGSRGDSYMINNIGNIIAYSDRDKVVNQWNPIEEVKNDESLKSIAELFGKVLQEKSGVSNFSFEDDDLYAAYAPIKGTGWTLVITAYEKDILSMIPILKKNIMFFAIIILIISIIITYAIGSSITNPIIKSVEHSQGIANLDITKDVPGKLFKRKDEIGTLSKTLQSITDSLREIISDISKSSEQVVSTSEELSATTQQSAASAEEVSKTTEEIAKGASDQAQSTEEGTAKSVYLGSSIEKNMEYTKNLNEASNKVTKSVDEGLIEMENLSNITEESNKAIIGIRDIILKTNESSIKIGQASDVISSIAEQTNLLALNAAIEAARAGETGRGFAVVAEEIRKLAEESQSSTESIYEMVKELQENSDNAVKAIDTVTSITEEQGSRVVSSRDKYLLIAEAMKEAEKAVKRLNVSGEEMDKMKNEILDTLENLSAIAQENSAATEEVTASMEEQTASIEEIASASEGLASLAENLQSIIMKFKYN